MLELLFSIEAEQVVAFSNIVVFVRAVVVVIVDVIKETQGKETIRQLLLLLLLLLPGP